MIPAIKGLNVKDKNTFFLIAGPCVVESETLCMEVASELKSICEDLQLPFIFKASYVKANRSKAGSFTGIGNEQGLSILKKIAEKFNIPVTTDVHSAEDATIAANFVDILQIPAFLCRQTDLLQAAAKTGKWVNVKKGQFLSPESMSFVVEKVKHFGNDNILLTERGTTFGYQDLVVDMRGIPLMKATGAPVVMDITHSLQQPNQLSGVTGGRPELIATIAKAAIASGADGIFLETHPNPSKALSDGANMIALSKVKELLQLLIKIKKAVS